MYSIPQLPLICSPLNLTKPANILMSPSTVQSFLWKNTQKSLELPTTPCIPSLLTAAHIQAAKVRARNNLLKALAGTCWDQQETLILTYQALGRSVIDYAAPVWAPVITGNTWKYLQTAQNEALRIATGCHKMSHTDHLHVETKLPPVKYHSELLAKQYWLSCYQSHHPCHHLRHPISHLLKVCCLGQSVPLSPS